MEELLEDSYFVGVPNGTVHDSLSNKNNGIVTFFSFGRPQSHQIFGH